MRRMLAGAALGLSLAAAGCGVSTQQEVDLGGQYAAQINQQLPIVTDPEVNRYINVLGDSIARLADPRGIDYNFYVVNSPEVNAFAVPGGHIYINRGLIERADNLAQLAGVLGHEIGHVVERHSVEQMQKMQGAQLGVALGCILTRVCESEATQTLINVGGSAVFAKFSRSAEEEADRVAIEYVTRAGISPTGIPEMFQKLLAERERRPAGVDAWFATHPLAEDRIVDTQAIIDRIPQEQLRRLTVDTQNFQRFKNRVGGLPAPPPQQRQG